MLSLESRCLKLFAVLVVYWVCPERANGLRSKNFSVTVIEHLLSKSVCVCVGEKKSVWAEKEVCTEASPPRDRNHTKPTYTARDRSAILKSVCWVAKPVT